MCPFCVIIIIIVTLTITLFFWTKELKPIFGVYRRPNKWYFLKFALVYSAIKIRKFVYANSSADTPGYGIKSRQNVKDMDKVQTLPENAPMAVDAVFFAGASRDGHYFSTGIARRPNSIVNAFCMLKIPGLGLLVSSKHPETTLTTTEPDTFSAEGMRIQPAVPMIKWRINFDGKMKFDKDDTQTSLLNVQLQLEWTSDLPFFDFDCDLSPALLAKAIALEPWSREYFRNLKSCHQTHHEQMGYLKGKVIVEGHGEYKLDLNCLRDHSYASKRNWKDIHRYGMHNVTVEDGTKFAVGTVCLPGYLSVLDIGYFYTLHGDLYSVDSIDLKLYQHGENGKPPLDYAFTFTAAGKEYLVECQVLESPEVYFGPEWEGRMVERMCKYRVNGKEGWGYAEWEYRHHGGRPDRALQ